MACYRQMEDLWVVLFWRQWFESCDRQRRAVHIDDAKKVCSCNEKEERHWYEHWCSSKMEHHLIARTELLNTSGSTFQVTHSFRVEPITSDHPISQISTLLTIFCEATWKTEFLKTIHRQQRFSKTTSEKKSDELHKKCSKELWAILMFEVLLSYSGAVPGSNISLITRKV